MIHKMKEIIEEPKNKKIYIISKIILGICQANETVFNTKLKGRYYQTELEDKIQKHSACIRNNLK